MHGFPSKSSAAGGRKGPWNSVKEGGGVGMYGKGVLAGLRRGGSGAHLRLRYSPEEMEDGQRSLQWAVLPALTGCIEKAA